MWLQFKRTLRAGFGNVVHNKWLAVSVISVIAIALFIINVQIANIVANHLLLQDLQDRVNISVYFKDNVGEDRVHEIEEKIKNYPEVERVVFVSRREILERFNRDNEGNETMKEVVEVLDDNPFGDILNIKAYNPDDYRVISEKIKNSDFKDDIKEVNYEEHKSVINGLNAEIKSSQKTALVFGATLSVIAILVTFNTIVITIYTHRKEIEIMKLVGASNMYTVMPFVWEGFLYGAIAAILAILISYLYLHYIASAGAGDSLLFLSNTKFIKEFLGSYFANHIVLAVGMQFALGISLGVISSLIAIRKYLKV